MMTSGMLVLVQRQIGPSDAIRASHPARKVMDYIAIAFYAKKLIADSELLATNNKLLSEDEKDEQICASIQSLKDALESIVFRSVQGEELTEDETAEMQAEYEEKHQDL